MDADQGRRSRRRPGPDAGDRRRTAPARLGCQVAGPRGCTHRADRSRPGRIRTRTRTHAGAAATAPAGIEDTQMSATLRERPAIRRASNGGIPARLAVIRWALRMLRREWRQQLLILALITVAVTATVVGSAVATTTPSPATADFGTAQDLATFGPGSHIAAQIAS